MEITRYHHFKQKTLSNGQNGFVIDHGTRADYDRNSYSNVEPRVGREYVLVQRDSFVGNTNEDHGFYVSQNPSSFAPHERSNYGLWQDHNEDNKIDVREVDTFESYVGRTSSKLDVLYTTLDLEIQTPKKDQVILSEKVGVHADPEAAKSQVSFSAPKSWWKRVFSR